MDGAVVAIDHNARTWGLCLGVCVLGYVYLKRKYFTLRDGLPGMEPEFPFGNFRHLMKYGTVNDGFVQFRKMFGMCFFLK